MIGFDPSPGTHIRHACEKAVALATEHKSRVAFVFNDVRVVVSPGETAEAVMSRWSDDFNRNAEAYRNSPEGKAAEAHREARKWRCQRETADLVARLPNIVQDLRPLVRWCVSLSKSADQVGIIWKPGDVADVIEAAGWKANAHVGREKEDFDDPTVMGEYIVGQTITSLRNGMPPHPVIESFATTGGFLIGETPADARKSRNAGTLQRFLDGAPLWCAIFHKRHHLMPDRAWPGNISVVCTKCHARWQGIVDDRAHPESDHSFWAAREAQLASLRVEADKNRRTESTPNAR